MDLKRRKSLILLILLLVSIVLSPTVFAVDESSIVNEVGYIYEIQFPENQIEESGALKLKMTPGQTQTIPVKIRNLGSEELVLELSLNGARTNGGGGLEYGPSKFNKDSSMKFDLPDLAKIPEEITVAAKDEGFFDIKIEMPEIPFDGIVTGGVQLQSKNQPGAEGETTTIVNKIAYLFGMTLQMTEKALEPKLELKKVYPELENYRNAIFLDVSNLQAMKIDGVTLDVEIMKQGSKDVSYSSKKNNMEMAPNTLMSYPVSLGGAPMEAGNYTAHVLASAQGGEWEWDKDFTITKEQADQFNQEDVNLVQEKGIEWKWIALIVGVGIVTVGVGAGIKGLIKKERAANKKKSKNKKR